VTGHRGAGDGLITRRRRRGAEAGDREGDHAGDRAHHTGDLVSPVEVGEDAEGAGPEQEHAHCRQPRQPPPLRHPTIIGAARHRRIHGSAP
jgi:hypothetical protein